MQRAAVAPIAGKRNLPLKRRAVEDEAKHAEEEFTAASSRHAPPPLPPPLRPNAAAPVEGGVLAGPVRPAESAGAAAAALASANYSSAGPTPFDELFECRALQTHLLSVADVSPSSPVLRRTLHAVSCCTRQAELRIIRGRVASCLPAASLTEHGAAVATWGIDEEIGQIDRAFGTLEDLSGRHSLADGAVSSIVGASPLGPAAGRGGDPQADRSTLVERLQDVSFPRRYRAREFNKPGSIFRELRLTSTSNIRHQPKRGEKARNCALCKERETLYECRDCMVPLCTSQIRGFRDTCMAKWHEAIDLTEEEQARSGRVKEKKKAGKEEREERKKKKQGDGESEHPDDEEADGGSNDEEEGWDRFRAEAED